MVCHSFLYTWDYRQSFRTFVEAVRVIGAVACSHGNQSNFLPIIRFRRNGTATAASAWRFNSIDGRLDGDAQNTWPQWRQSKHQRRVNPSHRTKTMRSNLLAANICLLTALRDIRLNQPFLSTSLYFSKRGAYWDRLCRDVVGWLSRACTVAKRCILGL